MHLHSVDAWTHTHDYTTSAELSAERRTRWVVYLTLATMVVELVAGWVTGSMALLADGWHMGSHAAALGISVFAYRFSRQWAADARFTFGTGKVPVLAGYTSALFLGLGALIKPLPLDRRVVNRQGWVQFGAGLLLVVLCLPFSNLQNVFSDGGRLHQMSGFFLVFLLLVYFYWSFRQAKYATADPLSPEMEKVAEQPTWKALIKLFMGLALVILSSKIVIPTAEIMAVRLQVPEAIIAALLIAFGTSLPELVTVITAVLKGQGALAVGNIIGADILNVLFVAGVAAAATPAGLNAPKEFFLLLFPFMIFILGVFRIGIFLSGERLGRGFGALLLGLYLVFLIINITAN